MSCLFLRDCFSLFNYALTNPSLFSSSDHVIASRPHPESRPSRVVRANKEHAPNDRSVEQRSCASTARRTQTTEESTLGACTSAALQPRMRKPDRVKSPFYRISSASNCATSAIISGVSHISANSVFHCIRNCPALMESQLYFLACTRGRTVN